MSGDERDARPLEDDVLELACTLSGRYHAALRCDWLPAARIASDGGDDRAPTREDARNQLQAVIRALHVLERCGLHLDDPRHPEGFREALRTIRDMPDHLDRARTPIRRRLAAARRSVHALHGHLAAMDAARLAMIRRRVCLRCAGRLAPSADDPTCIACGWSPGSGRAPTELDRREIESRRRAPRMSTARIA